MPKFSKRLAKILLAILTAEVFLPFLAILISSLFMLDIPAWLPGLLLGLPIATAALIVLLLLFAPMGKRLYLKQAAQRREWRLHHLH